MRNIYDYYDDAKNVPLEKVELNVKQCNKIAHEAITARERIFVSDIILNAAKKGCFLDFSAFMNNCGLNVCWDDKVIEDE